MLWHPPLVLNVTSLHGNHVFRRGLSSGGASALKEPGHFEVRKSSSQVARMHFLPKNSWRPCYSCRTQNTGRQRCFTVKINKAVTYGNIFMFCSHYYRSKAIRRARQSGARAVDLPDRSFHLARPGVAPPLGLSQDDSYSYYCELSTACV